jgi:hypothetical protein
LPARQLSPRLRHPHRHRHRHRHRRAPEPCDSQAPPTSHHRPTPPPAGGNPKLKPLGSLPARGFINGLQISRSGRFLVAAVGQEPRMGRWGREPKARNGLLVHRLEVAEAE